jgi:hypothetical protein
MFFRTLGLTRNASPYKLGKPEDAANQLGAVWSKYVSRLKRSVQGCCTS